MPVHHTEGRISIQTIRGHIQAANPEAIRSAATAFGAKKAEEIANDLFPR